MTTPKVRLKFTLVGRSHGNKYDTLLLDSKDAHECMLNQIKNQFGYRPLYLPTKVTKAAENLIYPKFYAAGWFWRISNTEANPTIRKEKYDSELLVITHGDNTEEAGKNLMVAISNINWDDFARTI